MTRSELTAAEFAVYTAAFGAEFARSLAEHQGKHQEAMNERGAPTSAEDDEGYARRTAFELRRAQEDALYVAEHAVLAFRNDACEAKNEPDCSVSSRPIVFRPGDAPGGRFEPIEEVLLDGVRPKSGTTGRTS